MLEPSEIAGKFWGLSGDFWVVAGENFGGWGCLPVRNTIKSMTWVDFKLKTRRFSSSFITYFSNVIKKIKDDPITSITAIAAIILALQANSISKAAFSLAKNDTSQQTQIDQLKGLGGKQFIQNQLSQKQYSELIKQNKKLIEIEGAAVLQDSLTNELLKRFETELRQQLLDVQIKGYIDRREVRTLWTQLNSNANIYIRNYDSTSFVTKLSVQKQIQVFKKAADLIDKGLNNSYIILHQKQYNYWYIFSEQNRNTYESYVDTANKTKDEITNSRTSLMKWYRKYFINFYDNGVWPLVIEKPWQKEDWSRFEKTNYGSLSDKDTVNQ